MNVYTTPDNLFMREYRDLPFFGANVLTFSYVASYYVFTQFDGFSRIPFVLGVCLSMLALARGVQVGKLRLPPFWYLPWAFVLYAALTLLWAKDMDHALSRMAQIVSAVTGGFSIWLWTCNGMSWKPVAWGAVVGSFVLAGSMMPEVVNHGIHARSAGIAINANATGILLSYVAFFAWCAPVKLPRWLIWSGVGFILYAATFTGSRKVLLCLIAFLVLFAINMPSDRKRSARVIVVLAILIAIFAVARDRAAMIETVTSLQVYQRTEDALLGRDRSYLTRVGMYHVAVEMWKERPVTGWGVGQFAELTDFASYAHSNYAQLLANLGGIGFVLIYLFYSSLLLRAYRGFRARTHAGKTALVLLLMILALDTGMVSFIGKGSWLLLFFIEGLCSESEKQLSARSGEVAGSGRPAEGLAGGMVMRRLPAETGSRTRAS